MRLRNPLRFVSILGLWLVLTAPGPFEMSPAALSQESAPTSVSKTLDGNAVLTSRGLTRVANIYLLKEEIDAKEAIKEGEDALKQTEALGESRRRTVVQNQERLAILDEDLSTQKQQRNNLNLKKQGFSNQNLVSDDVNTQIFNKNQMQQIDNQIRDKQDSIDRLNQSYAQTQSRLQTELASLRELES